MELNSKELKPGWIGSYMKRGTRDLRLLAFGMFWAMFGFGAFNAAYTNFIVQVLHLTPGQLGVVESIRETPGFLIVFVAALTMRFAEPLVAAGALILFAVGIGAYVGVNSLFSLVVWSLVWSLGLHAWMTLQPSMTLALADKNSKGKRLGQLMGLSSLGTILGMLLVFFAGHIIGFRAVFVISGLTILLGAFAILGISKDIGHAEKPRMVYNRRYGLYYILTFLEGCRKQVFMTFAVFLLVRNYHTPLAVVAILMVINNIVNFGTSAWIGRMIDKYGERKILIICYSAAIPVFIGYAAVGTPLILYILYCLDNLCYIGSMGSTTYLHKIAKPQDVHPTLAMGVSFNHAAAVAVPLVGGLLWAKYGHAVAFYGGAAVVALSVLAVLWMKVEGPASASA
ncbi:MAG TPA: MFS transporter [Armatimonadota bacterium]|jgi:predicted MFS family arabinose efflux permease